jgi:putative oxidoreductase
MKAEIQDAVMAALRFCTGAMLAVHHGWPKIRGAFGYFLMGQDWKFIDGLREAGLPAPALVALVSAMGEFVGGILLAVGLFTRYGAFAVALAMIIAVYRDIAAGRGFELSVLYLLISIVALAGAANAYSLDGKISSRK